MSVRIQVVVDKREREIFHEQARIEGKSLSEWIRDAARARLEEASTMRLKTVEDLGRFFDECDLREKGSESDWQEHLEVIAGSRSKGLPLT